jgi:histidinol phosphatase-like enzyme (inositol monophosphatase family)
MNKTSDLSKQQLQGYLKTALQAARLGGNHALGYFQTNVPVIRKPDRSPVTRADREAEQIIRKSIGKRCPNHQLCGEEFGWDESLKSEFRWWIDPVDGTRQFIRGLPFWGTLIALEYRGEPVVGVLHHPACKLTVWAAKGLGCFANGKRCHVSKIRKLSQGTLVYGALRLFPTSQRKGVHSLSDRAYDERGFGDSFAHTLVIRGMAEAMVDPEVKPYDVAAAKICVEEAGGRFTSLAGKKTHLGGNALSTNGLVHEEVLKAFR